MSFQQIRATFESALNSAYAALDPAVPVLFDNVQETPPSTYPFVAVNINFANTTTPVLCPNEGAMEQIRGSVQVTCYVAKQQGMKQLEELATVGMTALVQMKDICNPVRPFVGSIDGPQSGVAPNASYTLTTISAPFTAKG